MKSLIIAMTLSLLAHPAYADSRECSSSLMNDSSALEVIAFLHSVQGRFQLGPCQVEIHACDLFKKTTSEDSNIGDLLVTDVYGREGYLAFYIEPLKLPGTRTARSTQGLKFSYRRKDQNQDEVAVEAVKNASHHFLKFLKVIINKNQFLCDDRNPTLPPGDKDASL